MEILTKKCLWCRAVISKSSNESMKNWFQRHKFCSKQCLGESMRGKGIKNAVKFKKGQRSKSWRHGMSKTRFYSIWCGMRKRCSDERCYAYLWYGGKGIRVDEVWKEFLNFKKDMYKAYYSHVEIHGEKQTTLDRVDSSKNYSKNNCRWATLALQGANRRRGA